MLGHVVDAPSGVPHLSPIAQRVGIIRPGSNGHKKKPPNLLMLANL